MSAPTDPLVEGLIAAVTVAVRHRYEDGIEAVEPIAARLSAVLAAARKAARAPYDASADPMRLLIDLGNALAAADGARGR